MMPAPEPSTEPMRISPAPRSRATRAAVATDRLPSSTDRTRLHACNTRVGSTDRRVSASAIRTLSKSIESFTQVCRRWIRRIHAEWRDDDRRRLCDSPIVGQMRCGDTSNHGDSRERRGGAQPDRSAPTARAVELVTSNARGRDRSGRSRNGPGAVARDRFWPSGAIRPSTSWFLPGVGVVRRSCAIASSTALSGGSSNWLRMRSS